MLRVPAQESQEATTVNGRDESTPPRTPAGSTAHTRR